MGVPWWVWPQSVVWVLVHAYLWRRLVANTAVRARTRRAGSLVLLVLAPAVPAALIALHLMSPEGGRWITWTGFVWYALVVYLLLVLVPVDAVRLVAHLTRRLRGGSRRDAEPHSEHVLAALPGPVPYAAPAARAAPATHAGPASDGDPASHAGPTTSPAPTASAAHAAPPRGPGKGTTESQVDLDRRRFLARVTAVTAGAVAVGVTGYGMATAFSAPRVERTAVRIRRLPSAAAGFRIALVSDTHLGPFLGRDSLQRVVDRVNATDPDLVALPGDLVDGTVADLRAAVEPLKDLRSRHGTYFTTGNHEYFFDADAWVAHLRTLGVRTLRNSRAALPHFDLAGVNDVSGAEKDDPPDYRRALTDRDVRRPVILLAHQPSQAREAEPYGVDLQLSGHTHGGQFFPGGLLNSLSQPVVSGHGQVGRTQIHVTRGTGFWGPPIRVGATPEITLLDLYPAP